MQMAVQPVSECWPVGDTVNVCAIRVEFVRDEVTGTSGNGTMGSAFESGLLLEPLPHNRTYFEDHLLFLRHYYQTVSEGKLPFGRLDVYPVEADSVWRVAYPMWHYNYNLDDELLNRRLTELFLEAIQLADAAVDFSKYDVVMIFHAGVGKDFNIGYDDTPFDLPSAFIAPADFHQYLPEHSNGFLTNDGILIDRGLLLPEGESQAGFDLSVNGVMTKLFGNWLGLPDLFDTQTGMSGIGRWGMMDQGSGNMYALVPAMPEAWSRAYMGWVVPDTIWGTTDIETLQVRRFGVTHDAPEMILLPITETEYYLIENRAADPDCLQYVECRDRQGRRMRLTLEGEPTLLDGTFGVVTEARNYDFGIPGAGLLIWHINETRILAGLEDNTVNADPNHRGVDLVEADGAQDIGEEYGFGFAGGGTELGAPEDAWWDDNDYHKQANGNTAQVAFNNTTFPAARTDDGAYSWHELSNFSPISSTMSFMLKNRSRVAGFPMEVPPMLGDSLIVYPGDFNGDCRTELLVAGHDTTILIIDSTAVPRQVIVPAWDNMRVVDIEGDGRDELLLGDDQLYIVRDLMEQSVIIDSTTRQLRNAIYNHLCAGVAPDSSPRVLAVLEEDEPGSEFAFGLALFNGEARALDDTVRFPGDSTWRITRIVALEPSPSHSWAIGYEAAAHNELLVAVGLSDTIEILWQLQAGSGLKPLACIATEAETLLWCESGWRNRWTGEFVREAECPFSYQLLDWDGDGTPETIKDGQACHVAFGTPVEGFPLRFPVQSVVAADFDGDRLPNLLGDDGQWHVFRHDLREPEYFPMARLGEYRFIFHWDDEKYPEAAVLTSPSYFASGTKWLDLRRFIAGGGSGEREINCAYADPTQFDPNPTYFFAIEHGIGSQAYSRSDWVYPWPNPTKDISHIRLTLPFHAQAKIRFYDIAGHLINELSAAISPGYSDVAWDVSNVTSGVYIAMVEIVGNGKTERAQLKIAVVK
jgi:M6 family metalloprotease-like protein